MEFCGIMGETSGMYISVEVLNVRDFIGSHHKKLIFISKLKTIFLFLALPTAAFSQSCQRCNQRDSNDGMSCLHGSKKKNRKNFVKK